MNRPSANERDLLERARQHDEAAFASLVKLYTPPIFRIVRRMVVDTMEAESILQETFWRLWQALPRYDANRPLLPYLATIASNLARDCFRRERRLEDAAVEDILERHTDVSAPDPGQLLDDHKTLERLAAAVKDLPFAYRAVVSLRYEADMSYEEIAVALSLPLNTVRTHLRRAKDLLRRSLKEAEDG